MNVEDIDITKNVCIDSRALNSGDVFIALKGESCNGHDYVRQAFERGASAVVAEKAFTASSDYKMLSENQKQNVMLVDNTYAVFSRVARLHKPSGVSVAGITGSCGKTTAKELAFSVLKNSFNVHKNKGNFNNHFGVPLTLMDCPFDAEILLSEMGASAPGDILDLARIAEPEVGIITNVFPSHLDGFGSLEMIYKTKLEMAEFLDTVNGTLIVNGDDKKLLREARKYHLNLITFGTSFDCDFCVSDIRVDEKLHFEINGRYRFELSQPASHLALNATAALALASFYNVDLRDLVNPFADYPGVPGRFQTVSENPIIINDAYNASPASFKAALQAFRNVQVRGRKVLVCGDMLELGVDSQKFHEELGQEAARLGVHMLVCVGAETPQTVSGFEKTVKNPKSMAVHMRSNDDAISFLKTQLNKNDAVLIKGSRGNRLEQVAEGLVGVISGK